MMSTGVYMLKDWINNLEAAKIAYYGLGDSHMKYVIPAWGGSSDSNLNRVLITQKRV